MHDPDDAKALKAMAEERLKAEEAAAAGPGPVDPEELATALLHEMHNATRVEGPKRDWLWVAAQVRATAHDFRANGEPQAVVDAMLAKADEAEERHAKRTAARQS